MNPEKKKILVIYDYFSPSYKAGGPTQSIVNMVSQLKDEFDFEIICSAYEFNPKQPLEGIRVNEWNSWRGISQVFYWDSNFKDIARLKQLFQSSESQLVFVNGVYSFFYNVLPLLFFQRQPIVLSARGMLKPDALRQKAFKKKVFLRVFRMMKWEQKVIFHATDQEEADGIYAVFGDTVRVKIAGNYPNILDWQGFKAKTPGRLEIVSISLMNRIKNHLEVLKALKEVKGDVTYRIFGPVHDKAYVEEVKQVILTMPPNIQVHYEGELVPDRVPEKLKQAHVFVLPSKSENFGHSIFEALVAGRPVITSTSTPWKKLEFFGVGVTVQLSDTHTAIAKALQYYIDMDETRYSRECEAARNYALQKVDQDTLKQQYTSLFDL